MNIRDDNPLVYSTGIGRITTEKKVTPKLKGDGIVRIQRQISGRNGKGVCVITGLELSDKELQLLATELKKKCGCGGAVKEFTIEIQGDKKAELKKLLESKGFTVKFAGG